VNGEEVVQLQLPENGFIVEADNNMEIWRRRSGQDS